MNLKKMIAILLTITCTACYNTRVIPLSDLEKVPIKSDKSDDSTYTVVQKSPYKVHEFIQIEKVESNLVGDGGVKIPANNIEVIEESIFSPGKTTALVAGSVLGALGIATLIIFSVLANTCCY